MLRSIFRRTTSYNHLTRRLLCNEIQGGQDKDSQNSDENVNRGKGGFAKAYEKFIEISSERTDAEAEKPESFASMLRNCKFMQMGDPEGRIVAGTIFHTVDDDLYIDFGWKFYCVCQRPNTNSSEYRRGVRVKLRISDLEMSTRFLGADSDVTLLEADATLLGLSKKQTVSQ